MKPLFLCCFFLVFPLLLPLSGCNNPQPMELSRRLIIEAIGIDAVENDVKVTLQTIDAFFGEQTKEGGDKKGSTKIYGFRGKNVADALSQVEPSTGLRPMFSQIKLIVLSKTAAYKGVKDILEFFTDETNLRPDIHVCVADGNAGDIVGAAFGSAAGAAGVLQETLRAGADTGKCVSVLLFRFLSLIYSETDTPVCPTITVKKSEISDSLMPVLTGTAFFKNDTLEYCMDEKNTQLYLFLSGGSKQTTLILPTGKGRSVTAELTVDRVRMCVRKTSEDFAAEILISATCTATYSTGMHHDANNVTTGFLQKTLKKSLQTCYRTLCIDHGFDICRLQKRATQKYPSFSSEKDGYNLLNNISIKVALKQK